MKRISLRNYEARHIALLKSSALGDVVHSLPVLHALRVRFAKSHITWIINRAYEPLIRDHPDLNATLSFDRSAVRRSWLTGVRGFASLLREIRRQQFDLVIDLQGLLRSGLMAWASAAPRRVGLSSAREGAAWFYTDTLADGHRNAHAVDRYWLVAEALGVGRLPKQFHVPIGSTMLAWAKDRLSSYPRPRMMINLGTRWETKRWPVEHFAELGRLARERFGGTLVLVGSPEEKNLADRFRSCVSGPKLDLIGETDLAQLAAVLAQADVMISNDSGPLHLAAALGRPVVAPYTCTSPVRTGPYGQMHGAVATQVWCAASYLKRCGRMECMKELTPDRLWPVLSGILSSWEKLSA
jgi:heptosyltransferase I